MKNLQRGQRFPLSADSLSISVATNAKGENLTFDVSCIGLDENGQLSNEEYFVFYNQPCAPNQSIRLLEGEGDDLARFDVNLSDLPSTIKKLVWVLTIDGQGAMNELREGYFRLSTNETLIADFCFTGEDFTSEKAVMIAELYERNGWRLSANGQGFAGGLNAVLRHFGAQVADDAQNVAQNDAEQVTQPHLPSLAHNIPESEKTPSEAPVVEEVGREELVESALEEPSITQATLSPVTPTQPTSKPVRSTKPVVSKPVAPPLAPFETVMDFSDRLQTIANRIPTLLPRLLTEEATKNALVMPFIGMLGYDVFDPLEVIPEYIADYGVKKGEKVDYAIVKDEKIIAIFECKKCGGDLNVSHASQLFRYFGVTEARVGVLTNGVQYRFFTDLEAPNKMDVVPFLEVDLTNLNDGIIAELKKLTKPTFNIDQLLTGAADLKYTREIKRLMGEQFEAPTDDFVRLFASKVFSGPLTPIRREYFRGLTKRAFKAHITELINERLKSVIGEDGAVTTPTLHPAAEVSQLGDTQSQGGLVITTDEIEAFHIIKAVLRQSVNPRRITARDTQSYFGILLDDNNRKPLARLYFNRGQKYLGLFDETRKETRVTINDLNDIYDHADELKRVLAFYEKSPHEQRPSYPFTSKPSI